MLARAEVTATRINAKRLTTVSRFAGVSSLHSLKKNQPPLILGQNNCGLCAPSQERFNSAGAALIVGSLPLLSVLSAPVESSPLLPQETSSAAAAIAANFQILLNGLTSIAFIATGLNVKA